MTAKILPGRQRLWLVAGTVTAMLLGGASVPAGATETSALALPPMSGWLPVFSDEFNGSFNGQPIVDTKNIRGAATPDGLDDRVWLPSPSSSAEAISVAAGAVGGDPGQPSDGYLTLRAYTDSGRTLHSGWLVTGENEGQRRTTFASAYGYAEARIKMAQPVGTNQAFFTYSKDLHWWYGQPLRDPAAAGIEVDIVEEFGATHVQQNIHWDGYGDTHRNESATGISCPGSVCQGNFHTYGVLWDPSGYRWFIDGQETFATPRGVSHVPLFMMIGAPYDGQGMDLGPKGDPRNSLMLIDYVKVWQPAISDIGDKSLQRNIPAAVPFTVSHVSGDPGLPGPRVSTVDAISSNQNVIRNADLKVYGIGADRSLAMMSRYTGGQAGTTTITVRAKNSAGAVIGSDTFTVTVSDPAATVRTLTSGAMPDLSTAAGRPAAVEFQTAATEGTAPTVTVRSSNQYLLPDSNFGLSGDGRVRTLAMTPLPTRTGTADVTVTVTDPADGSVTSDTFRLTVTLGELANGGFESGQAPWALIGGSAPVVSAAAARTGTRGMHIDVAAVKQKITVEPNTSYTLGAWGRTSATGGVFEIGVLDTNTYSGNNPDGNQKKSVWFDSTSWTRKEVVFTTGRHTKEIEVFASNAFLSQIGFDVDDFYLVDAPMISHVADQSIGHTTCVAPEVFVGRVGNPADAWTLRAAVTGGDTSLITAVSVVDPGGTNPYRRTVRITPTTDRTKSGQATVTMTATDPYGRQSTDSFTVWVNAGTFHNGSFEYNPFADHNYAGCAVIPRAWNNFFAPNADQEVISPYDWMNGYKNRGMIVKRVSPSGGTPFGGFLLQEVTGLQPNTEYVLSGWLGIETWPDTNVTLTDGAGLSVTGDVTAISPTSGKVSQLKTGWSAQRLSVRFRTGAAGTATVNLTAPNHAVYTARFHDITLLKA